MRAHPRDRPAAHRHHGAGRERDRQLRHSARFLAGGAAPLRAANPGRACAHASARAEPGRRPSERPPTRPSTPGTSRATSTRSPPPGKAELDLPMYVNASLTDPFTLEGVRARRERRAELERDRHLEGRGAAHRYRGARHLHVRLRANTQSTSTIIGAPDNPLLIPETGNDVAVRALLLAGARQRRDRLVAVRHGRDRLFQLSARREAARRRNARCLRVQVRAARADRARLGEARVRASDRRLRQAAGRRRTSRRCSAAGRSRRKYGLWQFGSARTGPSTATSPNKELPVGGAALIQLGPDEFLVAGSDVRAPLRARQAAAAKTRSSSTSRKARSRTAAG